MLRVENANKEVIAILQGKIERDNEKLFKKIPQKEQTEEERILIDSMTLGTNKNRGVLIASAAPSGGLFAVGIIQAIVGAVSYLPTLENPAGEEALRFFEEAKEFGLQTMQQGMSSLKTGAILLAIPIGVSAISLSTKIHQSLIKKRKITVNNNNVIVELIDDLLEPANEEDNTISFAQKFIKRVDLSQNTDKVNLEILKYLACHRSMLVLKEQGKASDEDVENIYNKMMAFLKEIKDTKDTSDSFKHNRYLNILIDEYTENNKAEIYLDSKRSR